LRQTAIFKDTPSFSTITNDFGMECVEKSLWVEWSSSRGFLEPNFGDLVRESASEIDAQPKRPLKLLPAEDLE
jgi:hypothetical protein